MREKKHDLDHKTTIFYNRLLMKLWLNDQLVGNGYRTVSLTAN